MCECVGVVRGGVGGSVGVCESVRVGGHVHVFVYGRERVCVWDGIQHSGRKASHINILLLVTNCTGDSGGRR